MNAFETRARNPEAVKLDACRRALEGIAAREWRLVSDGKGMMLETHTQAGEVQAIARFEPGATQDEMDFCADAPRHVRFLLALVDRAIQAGKAARAERARREREEAKAAFQADPKNFAAEASMKCDEPAFQRFLAEACGLEPPLTKDRAVVRLRTLLGISSRKELNEDADAAARWKALRGQFEDWRKL